MRMSVSASNNNSDNTANHQNIDNNDDNNNVYNDSFTEMGSLSDLKSVPSESVIATAYNSPVQSSNSNSESNTETNSESEPEFESKSEQMELNSFKKHKWPKFKRFRDPITGEEAIYEHVSPKGSNPKGGLITLCSELVTLSSISLFVASNLFAFTVGMLVGKRIAYDF